MSAERERDGIVDEGARLDSARQAFAAGEWRRAYETLKVCREARALQADDAWKLSLAAFLIGERDDFVAAAAAAHQAWIDSGDAGAASHCAFWVGLHFGERGELAQATGWFGRAARVIEDLPHGREHGYLLLPQARRKLGGGDAEAAANLAEQAISVGRQHADPDLVTLAMSVRGHAFLRLNRIDEGLALFDEAMVGVTSDELSPHVTGLVYCSVISACREVWSLRRAEEWTEALARWSAKQPSMIAYTGECRVFRAEILRIRGRWQDSMGEARDASERFARGSEPSAAGLAAYQLGEIHRLRGEFGNAMDAYRDASRAGYEPQPGLALLRLAQNDADAAASALQRLLAETVPPMRRARLLPALIEVMLTKGESSAAGDALAEMEQISNSCSSDILQATVAQWQGAIALSEGDARAAVRPLRNALALWQAVPAPYEAARVQELIASACDRLNDADGASFARDAARDTFRQLGAARDLARLEAPASSANHGLTPRECEVLARLATGMTNRAIGEELSIAEKTVARHVANIFQKLGVTTRSAATAYAWEHRLVDPSA